MQLPLQITFKDMEPSMAVDARIREKARKLEHYHDHITSCRVVVEMLGQHHHQGNLFNIRIDITVPGGEIVVNRNRGMNHAYEDVYVAVRDAFSAARRQLEDRLRRVDYKSKKHVTPLHGQVVEYFREGDHGTAV